MTGFSQTGTLTRHASANLSQRVAQRLFHRVLSGIEHGRLTLHHAGRTQSFGQASSDVELDIHVEIFDAAFYPAALLEGSVGVGRSYMEGHWSCSDLAGLVRLFARNGATLSRWGSGLQKFVAPLQRAWLWSHRNHRRGARRNIRAHYDLGNEFFESFLDPRMMYSAAYYARPDIDLAAASTEKLRRICRKLDLQTGDRVLEIGSGWGGFATLAAEEFGCHVTTITISQRQFDYARRVVSDRGLESRVDVRLCDYRDLEGTFDKIVSIEMIEAVGADHLDTYAEVCGRHLTPGGRLLLQAIIIDDRHYEQAVRRVDFIKKYIFPGSFIPSALRIHDAMSRRTDLRVAQVEDLTAHYAHTLRDWHDRFVDSSDEIRRMGFGESFQRLWRFYFKYCEGGFEERRIGVQQIVFSKPFDRATVPSGDA